MSNRTKNSGPKRLGGTEQKSTNCPVWKIHLEHGRGFAGHVEAQTLDKKTSALSKEPALGRASKKTVELSIKERYKNKLK